MQPENNIVIENPLPGSSQRADAVLNAMKQIKYGMDDGFIEMCSLLCEAQDQNFNLLWGYARFGDWVEASDLDLSARQAYYNINIAKKAAILGVSRATLLAAGISKLKAICSLEPAEHANEMLALLDAAPHVTLDAITADVQALKAKQGEEPVVYFTLKVPVSVKGVVDQAFELARNNYGDQLLSGDAVDISASKCLELVCLSYVQDFNNLPEVADDSN